ncbi:MAG: hypothetical protein ACK4S2_03330 [Gemmobacter sp.]|uniref:hypothetical protein n=1 Tax=Gemmobacter sp. TaxID=1898957 RepID=UPI00391B9284
MRFAGVAALEGALQTEARIVKPGRPELPGMVEPASLLLVSLPADPDRGLTRLHLRLGRLPDPQSLREGWSARISPPPTAGAPAWPWRR